MFWSTQNGQFTGDGHTSNLSRKDETYDDEGQALPENVLLRFKIFIIVCFSLEECILYTKTVGRFFLTIGDISRASLRLPLVLKNASFCHRIPMKPYKP